MNRRKSSPLGATLVVLSSLFYASYGIWTKLMGNFFGGYTASAIRSVVVLAMLIPITAMLHKFEPLRLRKNSLHIMGMIVASFFIWGPLYYAILNAGVGLALTVAYASIVIGMFLFGRLLAGEQLTKDKIISAALGFIGLGIIFLPGSTKFAWLALSAAALSGFGSAANAVITKKLDYNPTQATVILWTTSVIANVIMTLLIHEPTPRIGMHVEWLYLIVFAVVSLFATWTLVKGMRLVEAGAAGVLGLLEIVFGILFGVLFFQERPTPLALAGAAVIIIASAIPFIRVFNIQSGTLNSK